MLLLVPLILISQAKADQMHCVVTGEAHAKPADTLDYKGIRYGTCCPGCGPKFEANPGKFLTEDVKKGTLFGLSLFDPITGARIEATDDAPNSVYRGVKYVFADAGEKRTFDKSPSKFTVMPAKEALYCPIENEVIDSYMAAGGYVDAGDVRYYVCCSTCLRVLKKNPHEYMGRAAKYVHSAKVEFANSKS